MEALGHVGRRWRVFDRGLLRLSFKRGCWGRLGNWLRVINSGGRVQGARPQGWLLVAAPDDCWCRFARGRVLRIGFKRRCFACLGHWLRVIAQRRRALH